MIETIKHINCSTNLCRSFLTAATTDNAKAERKAEERGWDVFDGVIPGMRLHVCPDCVAKGKGKIR